jgi:twitching motility protein PilT
MAQLDRIFDHMFQNGASDLHLTSGLPPMIRESGEIAVIPNEAPITPEQMAKLLSEIAPKAKWQEFEQTGDADFAYEIPGMARFRGNYFVDHRGLGAVFRIIPSKILSVAELGIPPAVVDLCKLSKGLVLVTGPTGSGKSTTLAAMIDYVNESRRDHIITIEDPIEFLYPPKKCLVNQREVKRHTKSFKAALRAALREDPDVVCIGEMRDLETIEIALETAETGHLVFGTLHTTTAASTVDRLIDQFSADRQDQIRTMLASSLKGVVSQVLCKKIPKGRAAALEILVVNSAVSSCIRESKTFQIPSAMQVGGKLGMRLMNDSLLELVRKKVVSSEEALIKSTDKVDLQAKLQGLAPERPGDGIALRAAA